MHGGDVSRHNLETIFIVNMQYYRQQMRLELLSQTRLVLSWMKSMECLPVTVVV